MTLRWGLLGAGMIAERFARDLAYAQLGRPAMVASRDMSRARALADRIGGMEALDDYRRLVEHDGVDAVYVATPNGLHRDHCLMAIAAGKPVLCEKPIATTAVHAREISAAAEAAGVACMEAMWTRCLPLMTQLRDDVGRGLLGQITQVHASLGFAWEEAAGDPITDPKLGGGALLDLGVYGLSLVEYLIGMPDWHSAQVRRSSSGSIRDAVMLLRHDRDDGPVLSSVHASHSTVLPNRFEIQGTGGSLVVEAPFITAEFADIASVAVQRRDMIGTPNPIIAKLQNTRHWSGLKRTLRRLAGHRGKTISGSYPGSGLQFEADAFAECVLQGKLQCEAIPLRASIGVLEIVDEIGAVQTD